MYLANVEARFQKMLDGRRTIFASALNTYRSLPDQCLLSQMYEVMRCHESSFCNHSAQIAPQPQANFSMTLGFAAELNSWENCNTSTDAITLSTCQKHELGFVAELNARA